MRFITLAGFISVLVSSLCAEAPPADGGKPILQPTPGDFWVYRVVVEVAKDTQIPKDVPGLKIEELDHKVRATYQQTSVYRGLMPVREAEPGESKKPKEVKAHHFYISNGDRLEEIHYMAIRDNGLDALGSKQEGKTPTEPVFLSQPIPLVRSEWKGGEAFPFVMERLVGKKKITFSRKFRVLGWESLETDAGTFKALHVQVTGMNGPMELKRDYWFAAQTGFVKEVKKYYLQDKIIMTQTKVLTKTGNQKPKE